MMAKEDVYNIVATSPGSVILRTMQDVTVGELCQALVFSKPVRTRLLAQGRLQRSDGEPLQHVGEKIFRAEEIRIVLEQTTGSAAASDEPVEVLWHDRFALVANKPTGLLVHADGTDAPTLAARVQGHLAHRVSQKGWPSVPVAQAVNRLDVDTSGLVLFSLAREFQPAFDQLVAGHGMHKRYLAIVEGDVPTKPFTIDAPIARDRHDARRMRVGATGKPSQTRVACLERHGGYSLVACELRTGRKHQIRVHLAHCGHPLVGDALYNPRRDGTVRGMMLHAYQIDFLHPLTHGRIVLTADWPQRFAKLFLARDVDWSIMDET